MKFYTIKKAGIMYYIREEIILFLLLVSFTACNNNNPNESIDDYNKWTFSGYVVDGYTGEPLANVSIFYCLESGKETEYITDSTGDFYINNLPFGEKNFRFVHKDSLDSMYTEKLLVVSNLSSMSPPEGELADASKIVRLFPLKGSITGKVFIKLRESALTIPAESTLVRVSFSDTDFTNSTPSVFETFSDTLGTFLLKNLPLASNLEINVHDIIINNLVYTSEDIKNPILSSDITVSAGIIYMHTSDTTDWQRNSVISNVLSNDGYGLTGVPVDITPYYILSTPPDSGNIQAIISGGGDPDAIVKTHKDTVFIDPVRDFTYNELVSISLIGKDIHGNKVQLHFDSTKRFMTVQGIVPVSSNMWDIAGKPASELTLLDSMWVQFSEVLDTAINTVEWFDSDADIDLFGSGSKKNAHIRIKKDTLFVNPIVSLVPAYGDSIGFRISVTSKSGKRSNPIDFTANLSDDTLNYVIASNVLSDDGLGLTGIPVDIAPFYVLAVTPDPATIEALISGGGDPHVVASARGDTVFVDPVRNLKHNEMVTVTITGRDTSGYLISLTLDGKKQFKTGQGVVPVSSNMWDNAREPASGFNLLDTLWVQFSEVLDPDPGTVEWFDSEAEITLYGGTAKNNAYVWIGRDTLFLKPKLGPVTKSGNTIGFRVNVHSQNGTQSNPTDFTANLSDDSISYILKSNVLSDNGSGLTGISVDIVPYYVLAVTPKPNTIEVTISGAGDPHAVVLVRGDTIFIDPVKDLKHNETVTVTITGQDTNGYPISITLDGEEQFRTEQGMFAIASNTWDESGNPVKNFDLYDTMWIEFSKKLDTNILNIDWSESDADNDIVGNGMKKNADIWIHDDTLFVKPDLRIAVDYGETMGFTISVLSHDGRRSEPVDYTVELMESDYYIAWSNTKDQFGNMRTDFGVMESVIVVSSIPISEITAISEITDALPPPDLTLDNIHLRNDTIVYYPSLRLDPDTKYGMDFNITFKNNLKRFDILPVVWQTKVGIKILSTNNRESGSFRAFSAVNDSLVVSFSKPIDISGSAKVPFSVNITDVHDIPIGTIVKWNVTHTLATIMLLDTLPLADYDASPAYTTASKNTRAVDSVTFNLTTKDGEQLFKFGPVNEKIEIHSQKGFCALSSNIIERNDDKKEIAENENPVYDFSIDSSISITFNHAIDTRLMQLYGAAHYTGIQNKANNRQLPHTVSFSNSSRTLHIKPTQAFEIGKEYYVWIKDLPGLNINGARAINKHGGTCSGTAANNRLLTQAFRTRSPNISLLKAGIYPDTPTVAGIARNRLGTSGGFSYSHVVGLENINTESSIKFRISEVAWHENHSDSVEGYQVQVQRVDRQGSATSWYDYNETIESINYSSTNGYIREASIRLTSAPFYNSFLTPDNDGAGSFYINSSSLFNDSSQVNIRVRPYIGTGDAGRNEVGQWSEIITIADIVAPCDSDFVTAANVNSLAKGGIQITENIDFDNSSGNHTRNNGYIDIFFPEDMDPNGAVPEISFFYGPFGGVNPTDSLKTLPQSSWNTARKYRVFISVPVFDFTHASSDSGAFYNVSVAGCRDASGVFIQDYGSNGTLASGNINAAGRKTRAEAVAKQVQGSRSVVRGFVACD